MKTTQNWGIARHGLAVLAFTLALAGTRVASAAAVSPLAAGTPIPVATQTVSALEASMKWRSNSINVAGSRNWSKLIVFTSTSINVRLPIN
jgi:hypothetical protein